MGTLFLLSLHKDMIKIHSLPVCKKKKNGNNNKKTSNQADVRVDRKAMKQKKITQYIFSFLPMNSVHSHSVSWSLPTTTFGIASNLPAFYPNFLNWNWMDGWFYSFEKRGKEKPDSCKGTATLQYESILHLCPSIGSLVSTSRILHYLLLFLFVVLFLIILCAFSVIPLFSWFLLVFHFILKQITSTLIFLFFI